MANPRDFYVWFMNADESEVCRAVANEMHQEPGILPEDDLALLESNLPTMDEGHAACAVVILSHLDPIRLLPHLPLLLGDLRPGVWCAAERALLLLPNHVVTKGMVGTFRHAIRERSGAPDDPYAVKILSDRLGAETDDGIGNAGRMVTKN